MPITQEDLDRIVFEADEAVYRELTGALVPTGEFQPPNANGEFQPPNANGDCLLKFVTRAEADEKTMRIHFQGRIRHKSLAIRKLEVKKSNIRTIENLLAPTRLQWGLEIRIELNFVGVPYFSFYHNGVELFD